MPQDFTASCVAPQGVFTTIDDPSANPGATSVNGINNLGVIVGTFSDSSGFHSFIRSADGSSFMTIDYPSGFVTMARGINDNGDIVGSYETSLTAGQQLGFIATPASSTVPEPASLSLFLAGLAGIACFRRRQRT
jgi:uncharacterized membrane protein